jgi:hypothetical protein
VRKWGSHSLGSGSIEGAASTCQTREPTVNTSCPEQNTTSCGTKAVLLSDAFQGAPVTQTAVRRTFQRPKKRLLTASPPPKTGFEAFSTGARNYGSQISPSQEQSWHDFAVTAASPANRSVKRTSNLPIYLPSVLSARLANGE